MSWKHIGTPSPTALADARAHAHFAAQVLAAVGETHATHEADTSHTAMRFDLAREWFVGVPLDAPGGPLHAGLALPTLGLRLLRGDGERVAEKTLAGSTLAQALEWMGDAVARASDGKLAGPLARPAYEMPAHPLEQGAAFEADAAALAELARWFGNAQVLLDGLARREDATSILCWPHHFDLATLVVVARDDGGEATQTIGIGLSPGDESHDEPYWYVNHWPVRPLDALEELPSLPAGRWNSEGFEGGLLTGTEIASRSNAAAQDALVRSFLDVSIATSREILAGKIAEARPA